MGPGAARARKSALRSFGYVKQALFLSMPSALRFIKDSHAYAAGESPRRPALPGACPVLPQAKDRTPRGPQPACCKDEADRPSEPES
jgi:hypothetical protein